MKKLLFCSSIGFLLFFALAVFAAPPVVGKYTVVAGNVDVFKSGEERAVPVKENGPVSVGDTIRTKSKSFAQVTFNDNSTVRIAQNSKLEITEYMVGGKKGENKLRLARGRINAMVSTVASALTVETSSGKITTGSEGGQAGADNPGSMTVASAGSYGSSGSPGGPPSEGSGNAGGGSTGGAGGSGDSGNVVGGSPGGGLPGGGGLSGGFGGAGGGRGHENPEGSGGGGAPGFAGGGGAGPRGHENPEGSSSGGSLPGGLPGGGMGGPGLAGGGAGPRGLEPGADIASHVMVTFENNVMQTAMLGGQGRLVSTNGAISTLNVGNVATSMGGLVSIAPIEGFQQAGIASTVKGTSLAPTTGASAPSIGTTSIAPASLGTMSIAPTSLGTMSIAPLSIAPLSIGTMSIAPLSIAPTSLGTMSIAPTSLGTTNLGTVNTFNALSTKIVTSPTLLAPTSTFMAPRSFTGGFR